MYFVIELQKDANGNCSILTCHEDSWTYRQAESVYYGKLQYAAISALPVHTVMLADVEGAKYQSKTYTHEGAA